MSEADNLSSEKRGISQVVDPEFIQKYNKLSNLVSRLVEECEVRDEYIASQKRQILSLNDCLSNPGGVITLESVIERVKTEFRAERSRVKDSEDFYHSLTAVLGLRKDVPYASVIDSVQKLKEAPKEFGLEGSGNTVVVNNNPGKLLYATILGSSVVSGLVCATVLLLMGYKAPSPDGHLIRAAESEIASTRRPLEISADERIGRCVREVKGYVSNKLSYLPEIAKLISPSPSSVAAEATSVPETALVSDAAKVAVGGMSTPPDSSKKDITSPKVSLSRVGRVTKAEINSKYYTLIISGEMEPVTCSVSCPNTPTVTKHLDNVVNDYKLPLSTCPLYHNEIYTRVVCIDKLGNISKQAETRTKVSLKLGKSPSKSGTKTEVVPESAVVSPEASTTKTDTVSNPAITAPDKPSAPPGPTDIKTEVTPPPEVPASDKPSAKPSESGPNQELTK